MSLLIDKYSKKKDSFNISQSNEPRTLLIDKYSKKREIPTQEIPEEKPKRTLLDKIKGAGVQIGKFAVRTGVEAANLVSSTIDFVGDALARQQEKKIRKPSTIPLGPLSSIGIGKETERNKKLADDWKEYYNNGKFGMGRLTEKFKKSTENWRNLEFIKPSEEWTNASNKEKFTEKLPETVLNIGPGIVSSLGMFALNPTVGFVASTGSVADEIKTIAMDNGVSEKRAETLGLGTGLLVGFLDKIVPDEIFSPQQKKKFISSLAKKVLKTGLKEAATEIVQEDVQLLVEATIRDDITKDEVVTRNLMSGLGGLIGGVGADTMVTFVNGVKTGQIGGIDDDTEVEVKESVQQKERVLTAPVDLLVSHEGAPDTKQVELVKRQIEAVKTIEPIKVIREGEKYGIEDGKHRFQAYKELGIKDVPIELVKAPKSKSKQRVEQTPVNDTREKLFRGDTTKIPLEKMDTTKMFEAGKQEALSAFNNTPGLYFTDSIDNAKSYGENITTVSIKDEANIIDVNNAPKIISDSDIKNIVKSNPNIKEWATNWSENFDDAINQIVESVRQETDGNEFMKAIWADGGFNAEDFPKALKKLGIDGLKVQKDDVNHYVVYNKDVLTSDIDTKPKEVKIKRAELKEVSDKQIKNAKDIKSTKKVLKNIRSELSEAIVEGEGMAMVAQEQRSGVNIENINKLKRIYARTKAFQEGDIETIRASKHQDLIDTVIEDIQENHPEFDEEEAFDFALELPTKADENARTPTVRELEKKEKKLSKYLNQLKEQQKSLKIKEDTELSKEWQRAIAAQEKLIKIIRMQKRQMPVGQGKERLSRLQNRLKGTLETATVEQAEELGLTTYRQMNRKNQIAMATDYVSNNPEEAIRVIKGEIDPPDGVLQNSVYAALVNLGQEDTDIATQIATLTATKMGQEINILQEIMADNPVVKMQEVVKTRIEAYEKKRGVKIKDKVKNEVKKINKEIKAPDKTSWDNFLAQIRC